MSERERFFQARYTRDGGLTITVRPRAPRLLPSQARGHLRRANREVLLAVRDTLDRWIERVEPEDESGRERRRIQVEGE